MNNKVRLIGHLGQDPEHRQVSENFEVCSFSLATTSKFKNKKGELITETEWHKVECFNKLADIARKFLKKGSLIALDGSIKYESFEKEGEKKYITKIRCTEFLMLDKKEGSSSQSEGGDDLPF